MSTLRDQVPTREQLHEAYLAGAECPLFIVTTEEDLGDCPELIEILSVLPPISTVHDKLMRVWSFRLTAEGLRHYCEHSVNTALMT